MYKMLPVHDLLGLFPLVVRLDCHYDFFRIASLFDFRVDATVAVVAICLALLIVAATWVCNLVTWRLSCIYLYAKRGNAV